MTYNNENAMESKPIDILLVDDNEADLKITLRAFQKAKMKNKINVVRDGQQALDYMYRQGEYQDDEKYPRPDLLLLDIKMPKVDGFEVLEKLKSDKVYRRVPIIMLTSSKNEEDIVRSYGKGAASYIQKPVTYEVFVKVVDGFNFYWSIVSRLASKNYKMELEA